MERNLNYRVETCFPILQPDLAQRVLDELNLYLEDGKCAWELKSDGGYVRVNNPQCPIAQATLLKRLAG